MARNNGRKRLNELEDEIISVAFRVIFMVFCFVEMFDQQLFLDRVDHKLGALLLWCLPIVVIIMTWLWIGAPNDEEDDYEEEKVVRKKEPRTSPKSDWLSPTKRAGR